jgi:pyruvate dehydrogenase E2 component (dihydrolipoamide acetyltransferase)
VAKTLEVTVPDLGDFHDVAVIEFSVKPGDSVQKDQALLTLETDKATMDLPSPFAGVIKEFFVAIGNKVNKGARVASLEVADGGAADAPAKAPTKAVAAKPAPVPARGPAVAAAPALVEPAVVEIASDLSSDLSSDRSFGLTGDVRKPASHQTPAPEELSSVTPPPPLAVLKVKSHASPTIRRLGRELGVDLTLVKGTGRHGRIVEQDVKNYVKEHVGKAVAAAGGFVLPEAPFVDFARFGLVESQPLSRIKRVTATHLHVAWLRVVHVTQHDEADITDLESFRKSESEKAKKRNVHLTLLPFIMKAVVAALKEFPTFNASLDASGENLILKRYFHLGVAVDTSEGLVVPVIRDVDRKGVYDLAAELAVVSEKARAHKLMPGDMQGGSFTISSLGGIGGTAFTPIVNIPEVAILGVSRASMKPVYENGAFVPRLTLPLSLSYDHRVNDGADAARFTTYLRQMLSDIKRLLL